MIVKQCTWRMAWATGIQGQERCKQYIHVVGGEAVPKNAVDLIFEGSKNPGERVHMFHVCIVIIFHFIIYQFSEPAPFITVTQICFWLLLFRNIAL